MITNSENYSKNPAPEQAPHQSKHGTGPARYGAGLNPRQLEAVKHGGGPLLIAAGAGSGKTRTLTSRIAYLIESGVQPENILAITFTNKAANEMKGRILEDSKLKTENSKLFIGTFHSFGAKILRQEHKFFDRTKNFTIFDDDDGLSLIKKLLKNRNLDRDKYNPLIIQNRISKIKSELTNHKDSTLIDDRQLVEKIFDDYERVLAQNNAFDFDDLIEKPVKLLRLNLDILEKYQNQYHHILVDEYQDINTAQYQLIRLLAKKHKNLSVVGDDAQSIYAFRGADFRNFLNFERDWPEAKIVLLEENYRSTPTILRAANEIIKNNKLQKQKNLWTQSLEGAPIKIFAADDEPTEAEWVVHQIQNLRPSQGLRLEQVAVLYRTNAQSRAIEQALIYSRIPYQIFGGLRFYERKEIKDIVAGLRVANNPQDTVSAERLIKNFSKGKSSILLENLPRLAKELTTIQLINYFINNTDYFDYLEKNFRNHRERLENIKELLAFATNFSNQAEGLGSFLEQISLAQSHDQPEGERGVNLMTIHLAKGLEFDHVFLIGCSEGTLPHHRSYNTAEELEEERRLMYVAVTRAAKNLFLSFSHLPSRFLYEIPPELISYDGPQFNKQNSADDEDLWIDYDNLI